MTDTSNDRQKKSGASDDPEALLPWYVTGRLSEEEVRTVERYLADNPEAQARLDAMQRERRAVRETVEEIAPPDQAAGLSRLMQGIDATEAAQDTAAQGTARPGSWLSRLGGRLAAMPRPALAGAGFAAAAVVVAQAVVIALLVAGGEPGRGQYEPASGQDASQQVSAPIIVAFHANAPASEVARVLESAGVRIVEGPMPGALYRLALEEGPASEQRVAEAIERLRAHDDVVRFVGASQ